VPVLPVGANTNPASLAGAITRFIKEDQSVSLSCIGAGSNFSAGKALSIAKLYLSKERKGIIDRPRFEYVEANGDRRSAVIHELETYPLT